MKAWEVDKIRQAVKGKWLQRGGATPRAFNGRVCTDSRKAAEGDLFIAIVGPNHDAHVYVEEVIDKGAAAVLVHKEQASPVLVAAQARGCAVIQVEDTIAGLNRLAAAYRAEIRAKVIAVGGSNGKTTTKRIIHALLSEKFNGHASPKSFNNNIGMPLTMLEVEPKHEYVVLEIGTNAPGEIAALGAVCRPDIAVITSVGLEHLEKLGSLEGVAREEASIAPFVAEGGTLVLPADSAELAAALKNAPAQKIRVGGGSMGSRVQSLELAADLSATDIVETIEGTRFAINGRGGFGVPLLGAHNALNALMAIAVARRLGLSDELIAAGLRKVQPVEMRLEPMTVGGYRIINDAYNANPSSVEAALLTFARLTSKGRKVAILGDMLELGSRSEEMHRLVGGLVASSKIGLLVAVGPQMRYAGEVAAASGITVERFADVAAAGAALRGLLRSGDEILLKGSRGMAMERILDVLRDEAAPAAVTH